MKKFFLLLIVILAACTKDGIQPASLNGTWKWIYTYKDLPLDSMNPLTPLNTGIEEKMVFTVDGNWKKIQNNITNDSGTYTLGHGSYTPYVGATTYIYDSIGFFRNGVYVGWDYYQVKNDTLFFCPCLGGSFASFTLPYNGSKWWIKE